MSNQEQTSNFEGWAVLEVFGHETYSGFVSSIAIAGNAMIKVEVPETKGEFPLPPFTKMFNPTSLFSLTPVSEEYAKEMAIRLKKHPIQSYEHEHVVSSMAKKAFDSMTMTELKKLLASHALTEGNGGPKGEKYTEDNLAF